MERSKWLRSTSPFVYCYELWDMTVAEELLLRRNERKSNEWLKTHRQNIKC